MRSSDTGGPPPGRRSRLWRVLFGANGELIIGMTLALALVAGLFVWAGFLKAHPSPAPRTIPHIAHTGWRDLDRALAAFDRAGRPQRLYSVAITDDDRITINYSLAKGAANGTALWDPAEQRLVFRKGATEPWPLGTFRTRDVDVAALRSAAATVQRRTGAGRLPDVEVSPTDTGTSALFAAGSRRYRLIAGRLTVAAR